MRATQQRIERRDTGGWKRGAGYLVLQQCFSKGEREGGDMFLAELVPAAQGDGALHASVNFLRAGAHMQGLSQVVGEQVNRVMCERSQSLQRKSTCSAHESESESLCLCVCVSVRPHDMSVRESKKIQKMDCAHTQTRMHVNCK